MSDVKFERRTAFCQLNNVDTHVNGCRFVALLPTDRESVAFGVAACRMASVVMRDVMMTSSSHALLLSVPQLDETT
jgi:hypothetical protein